MQEFITTAKTKSAKEFIEEYKFPFLIQVIESGSENSEQLSINAATIVAKIDDIVKASSNIMAIKNILPVLKTKKNMIKDMIIVGRDNIQDIVLNNKKISKCHAYFKSKDGIIYFLLDPGSINGTFLNGERLPINKPNELKNGDVISFADLTFRFYMSDSAYYTIRIFGKKQ